MTSTETTLSIRDLSVTFDSGQGPLRAVEQVSLDIFPNETVALVGESGCGKTMTALSILGLVPPGGRVSGSISFQDVPILGLRSRELRSIRGAGISMIFQDPIAALNPTFTIGRQISHALRAHDASMSRRAATTRAIELLSTVGIPDAPQRISDHPFQWSGGMCQRAMIAMAIANSPRLVIADEPTTALDVTVQAQVLALLREAQRTTNTATLIITHDLGVVAEMADRVAVMYAGRIVEIGDVSTIFHRSRHPYSLGLLSSLPRLDSVTMPIPIPGQPPHLDAIPSGCAFHPRCDLGQERTECSTLVPPMRSVGATDHESACHLADQIDGIDVLVEIGVRDRSRPEPDQTRSQESDQQPILRVDELVVRYPVRSGLLRRVSDHIDAVDRLTLSVDPGETLGLVGESGCGKSTTAHSIVRLLEPTSGRILVGDNDLGKISGTALREARRGVQIVFQDPHASLNPKMRVGDSIAEPLLIHRVDGRAQVRRRVRELLELVGLSDLYIDRFPHEFSGGQLQRVGIARALALDPQILVLDEPVSSLDVSIQAQILLLLRDLQQHLGTAYLFISHDLSVVRHISDRVAVMYNGRIVESGRTDDVFERPQHPYTAALLDAIPRPDPERRVERSDYDTSTFGPVAGGCAFRLRCPRAGAICGVEIPALFDRAGDGQMSACHLPQASRRTI